MRYRVRHLTRYVYEAPVFLDPHILRFRPRDAAGQRLLWYALAVDPAPATLSETLDFEGNTTSIAWFEGITPTLTVDVSFEVETTRSNPYDFLLLPAGLAPLPWTAPPAGSAPFLQRGPSEPDNVGVLARALLDESTSVTAFLTALTARLYESLAVDSREFGEPYPAEQTLAQGHGSCRDLAVLFADACRAAGIPARFVSGYQEGDEEQDRRELHAWAEAYIPGGGWRGFDPTHGIAVSDRHIAVAAAAHPLDAAPVTGSYRGSAGHTLAHEISLDRLD